MTTTQNPTYTSRPTVDPITIRVAAAMLNHSDPKIRAIAAKVYAR